MVKLYALATAVAMYGLALTEVDWLVKNGYASYASKNGNTALRFDAAQVGAIISDQREAAERRWRR